MSALPIRSGQLSMLRVTLLAMLLATQLAPSLPTAVMAAVPKPPPRAMPAAAPAAAPMPLAVLQAAHDVAARAIEAHIRFLADDLLEGRGTGTRGYGVASRYVAAQMQMLGLERQGRQHELVANPNDSRSVQQVIDSVAMVEPVDQS